MTASSRYDCRGRGVLVTGAAGDIGEGVARRFLELGARVHVTDVEAAALQGRAAPLAGLGELSASAADLADPAQVRSLAHAALEALGRVDILVNNAAIQAVANLEECSQELFDLAYAVNVRAPYLLAKALVPSMRDAGGGAIVNISSVHATAPGPHRLAYATTKTALLGLTRSLAIDLGRDNIRVNAVSPGATMTSQLRAAWAPGEGRPDILGQAVMQHPLGRIATVEDVAEAVVYLAEASFVSGIELRVDGGFLAGLRLLSTQDAV